MNLHVNLDTVERSIFRYYWEDGLVDLLLGVGLVLFGVTWLSGLIALGVLVPVALLPVWIFVRKRVTEPRAGHVVFSDERREATHQKLNIASIIGFALLTLFGALYVFVRYQDAAEHDWLTQVVPGIPSFLLAVALLVTYVAFAMPRFIGHAGVLMAMAVVGASAGVDPGWQFLVAGLVITTIGAWQFARFLKDFPSPEEVQSNRRSSDQ